MVEKTELEWDKRIPLLLQPQMEPTSPDIQSHLKKTGNQWTAVAHIITGVIGAGVLSLAWSVAQLGWIAGPLTMLIFASITFLSASLLINCYRYPDPDIGPSRNPSYLESVRVILGKKSAAVCSVFLRLNFLKLGIVYTITSATSMRAILRSNCYHFKGHKAPCRYDNITVYMVLFGLIQIVLSQIPNFQEMQWLSNIAAAMSFSYASIGSALSLGRVIENGEVKGSIEGAPTNTTIEKIWLIAQALGSIAFAFPFAIILIEIQGTLRPHPPEKVTMKKASTIAICTTTFFYLCCGGFGYAAFGSSAPGNILTGFGFYEPYWLIDFANVCIITHLVGAYQVFSQPLYADLEGCITGKYPNSSMINSNYTLKVPILSVFRLNLLRLILRSAYVCLVTGVAVAFPYFNQVVGVAGGLNFWPLVIFFPVEMYFVQKKTASWTAKWILLRLYTVVMLFVSLFSLVGSVQGLIKARFG
ncbi:probable amino acid permease 7 [Impatiens glandulifera]|uniref:probable amino acid permease 7 n=1 Tax=Impatiens glandulifera TaxID=253017 RepID=UPI001FB05F90|nr:probable amino acid permease 7 [Impatiens glandulifera]